MLTFLKQNLRWIAGGFALTYFSSLGQTYFISASIAEWQALLDLSHGEIGRVYMFATLASAACLPFLGRITDTLAAPTTILIVVPVLATAAILAAFANSVWMLLFAIFLLRLFGQGMMTQIALTATGRWFAAQRGRAVSLVVLGHQGGEGTLPLAFAALSLAYGYQAGWIGGAALLIVVGLPFTWWAYRQPREPLVAAGKNAEFESLTTSWTRRQVLADPLFYPMVLAVLAPAFIGTTIFYHQNYMATLHGWPPQLFAMSLVFLSVVTVVFALISGAAIDRFAARVLLPFFLLPLSAACFAMAVSGPPYSLFVVMFLLGISYGFSSTLFGALWPEVYGTKYLGSIRAVTVSAAVVATAAGPGLTGTLIDAGIELPQQMFYLGIYCLAVAALMVTVSIRLQRRRH